MLQLPRVVWRLLACENGASPDCIIVAVAVAVAAAAAAAAAAVVVVVSDTCESVCMCTAPQTCKATS